MKNNTESREHNRHHTRPSHHGRGKDHFCVNSVVALVLAAFLTLTGCTSPEDGAAPGTTAPPATSSVVTVPATTPAPMVSAVYQPATETGPAQNVPVPVLPEKAKEFSKEGLIAFAEYWYSTLGYAFETGDPEPMEEVTDPGCRTCNAMKESVVPWNAEGRWIVGGQMQVLTADTTFAMGIDGNYQVTILVRQQNVKFYRADKTLAEDRGAKPTVADILIANYGSGRWGAITVEHLKGSES